MFNSEEPGNFKLKARLPVTTGTEWDKRVACKKSTFSKGWNWGAAGPGTRGEVEGDGAFRPRWGLQDPRTRQRTQLPRDWGCRGALQAPTRARLRGAQGGNSAGG